MKDIYISITTIPSRINLLSQILNCFLKQSVKPKKILLVIPLFSNRFNKEYEISNSLYTFVEKNKDLFEIVRTEIDYGPATKLLGAIHHVPKDAYILVCDDDRLVADDFVEKFYNQLLKKQNDRIIAGKYTFQPGDTIKTPWGCNGILFPQSLIGSDIFEYFEALCPECQYVDDVFWYKYFIELKNIDIEQVNGIRVSYEFNGTNPLYKEKGALERNNLQKKCFEKKINVTEK